MEASIKTYEEADNALKLLKKEYDDRKVNINKLEKKIHQFDVQIQQEPDVKFDTLVKLKPFFEDVADTLLKRKKEKIEEDMKEQLNKLLISYKGCIARVELSDSMQNFTIRLFHKAGNEISLNQLNAASKQIFIQVLLKVLRNLGDYNPLIMKQQTIADGVVKDLFGVSGKEFQDIKSAIADLQKGELIIKDNTMSELGLGGRKYKKIKVTRLI